MRVILLTALTMIAFAANSVLNRMAIETGGIDPAGFALIRVAAGAAMLVVLLRLQGRKMTLATPRRLIGAGALTLYMIGFSLAYLTLDAGLGALILFGVVQITMFVVSAARGIWPSPRQLAGAMVAFGGLLWVLWPGENAVADPAGALLMVLAGIGWGFYTLAGKAEPDALAGTAANFVVCLPLVALLPVLTGLAEMAPLGVALAVISGAVTSGMGYALWYSVLPKLEAAVAATVQLSVPVIALAGGVLFLGETLSLRFLLGGALVLGGIALTLRR
ncbi:DMT family transporter [Thalassococcus sp. S3]|uniref:DMT family transporter n=1 Tax=Thalassococcus sp. S3 TaxID=2017482 RepID=UPI00102456B0|nr:DMT family transporter [Thalassococcus sp. S3]QBF30913.1 EamA family transporter [Thalassococcus sp. S3]